MGASTDFRIYRGLNKAQIKEQWAKDCEQSRYDDGNSYSGCIGMLRGPIEFKTKVCDNEREAEDMIADKHEKYLPPWGVPFKDGDKISYVVGGWCSS